MRSFEPRACDGVTTRPRDGVTLDVIGGLASELLVRELVLGIKNLAPGGGHGPAPGRRVDDRRPRSDLKLPSGARSTIKMQPSHIKRSPRAFT